MLSTYLLAHAAFAGLVAALPIEHDNSYTSDARPRIQMYEPFYTKFERYAHFASASGSFDCSNPPFYAVAENYVNIDSTTTQATLFRADPEREFILAFPGSSQAEDYKLDAEDYPTPYESYAALYNGSCDGCEIHTGFYKAWTSAAAYTMQVVDEAIAEYPDYKLTITGYSLGGALANLAYGSFKSHTKYPVTGAFTYGQPRVGNQAYADYIDELSGATEDEPGELHRITHVHDVVPQEPGQNLGYQHSRTEYFQEDPEEVYNTYRCSGQEPDDCSKAQTRYVTSAHFLYSGVSMIDGSSCEGDDS